MICVANKIDLLAGKDYQAQREKWLDWCLDRGFELIECSALKDEAQGTCIELPNLAFRANRYPIFTRLFAGSEEAEGVSRLIEALSNHTWAGLQVVCLHAKRVSSILT